MNRWLGNNVADQAASFVRHVRLLGGEPVRLEITMGPAEPLLSRADESGFDKRPT
jgi:hypothetical protein